MPAFALATLTPALLIALGAVFGGLWAWAALAYMTLLTAGLDALIARIAPPAEGVEFPAADALSAALAVVLFALLPLTAAAVAGVTGIGTGARVALFLAAGQWFGQVGHPNAHELIHRGSRTLFNLGKWSYIALLFGHHTSAHRLVHHVHVGTQSDPNTPRKGEGFWRFAPRAWAGSFRAGLAAERRKAAYADYLAGALAMLAIGWLVAGWQGALAWLGLAAYAQLQILLSDYVQHYGLDRARGLEGTSWNAPHWFSSRLMLNAPRHSDHHAHPSRPYPALRLDASGAEPTLPYALPVMAGIAMVPPLWRRVMRRALRAAGR